MCKGLFWLLYWRLCAETRLSRRYLYIEEKNPDKTPFRAAVTVMTEKVARSASQQYLSPSRFAIKPPGKEKKETKKKAPSRLKRNACHAPPGAPFPETFEGS